MNRLALIAVSLMAAAMIVGCAPMVTIVNNTKFPVRAIVSSGGRTEVLSPSPGESSSVEVAEGSYQVSVIPDAEWIEYAKLTRKVLNDQLANADKLTGPQLLDVIRRLKDIAARMQDYERAADSVARCGGKISSDGGDALVTISASPSGALVATCR